MAHSINETLHTIASQIPVVDKEIIPIELAAGRILAESYTATFDLPRFDNSAMDGYAVKLADKAKRVTSVETIYAGDNPNITLHEGMAIKIMTGAPIPKGCEAVVPIEHISQNSEGILLPEDIKHEQFIRKAGEDIKKDTVFLDKGERLNAYSIASLASQGISHVAVTRKIKVAIFGTGDELRPHFEKIEAHQLYNSNSPMFLTRSKELGCEVRFIRSSADTLESLENSIRSTLDADIIITSGGVSVGDKDFTKEAFTNLGMQLLIDQIDIKPGRPTLIGKINRTIIVNLPGNPLASMVNYELFVRAIVRKMSGYNNYHHGYVTTTMKQDYALRGGKYAVVLGKFDGKTFEPLKPQMPGMVSPMQEADGLILVTPDIKELPKGSWVKMLPIRWEFGSKASVDLFSCS